MDPDETQMFVEAYWWRWEMEDRMQAHYASQQLMAAGVKKEKAQPRKVRFLSEWQYGDDGASDAKDRPNEELEPSSESEGKVPTERKSKKQRDEEDREAMRRLKEFSKQRAKEQRARERRVN